jgi:hypothetical protein
MCEHFVARAAEPFRLDELWDFAERLERFGTPARLGAAWIDERTDRQPSRRRAFRDGPPARPSAAWTTSALVHLRRPRPTTISRDTQPFDDPVGRYATV